MPRRSTTPDALLDAAMARVLSAGLAGITIDAVAASAGVSKGAVLHHFPTKSALMAALVRRFADRIGAGIAERLAKDRRPGAIVRAILDLSLPAGDDDEPTDAERVMLAVLAAGIHDAGLVAPMREMGAALRERMLADERRGLDDLLIILARDGMLLWQLCGMLGRRDPLAKRLGRELRRRAAAGGGS